MIIQFIDAFDRVFEKLERPIQDDVRETLRFFREHPEHPSLRNHPLTGSMNGKRSISVSDDLRIIFVEK
jgi:mRNA-degrading endonuclease YafQ of YafQ-DinJ toxin-antitoxin module